MTAADGIAAALARAQARFTTITKDRTANAGKYGYSYADIADVLASVRPVLAAEGIAIVQPVEVTDNGMVLVTRLLCGSEAIESRMALPIEGEAPQQVGSLMTYYRRYALCALVGVAPENEDDDGQAAQQSVRHDQRSERSSGARVASGGKPGKPSDKQLGYARKLLDEVVHHSLHAKTIREVVGREDVNVEELTTAECSAFIDWLLEQKKAGRTPDGDVSFPEGEEPW
jgi:hypothetical protein